MIKKLLLAVAILGTAVYSQAQGYVNFNTYGLGSTARVYGVDGVTPLSGTGFYAQLYAADGALTSDATLTAKGTPVNFYASSISSGKFSGYVTTGGTTTWDGSTVSSTVAVTASSAVSTLVTIQLRAWSADTTTTSYSTASQTGKSALLQVNALSAYDADGKGQTPASLTGLTGFGLSSVTTPEPATIALGALGLSVLLFRRRK
jgi:hypothetical protein